MPSPDRQVVDGVDNEHAVAAEGIRSIRDPWIDAFLHLDLSSVVVAAGMVAKPRQVDRELGIISALQRRHENPFGAAPSVRSAASVLLLTKRLNDVTSPRSNVVRLRPFCPALLVPPASKRG